MENPEQIYIESEKSPPLKRIFIELGTNSVPVTFLGNKTFGENETYIGIDIDPKNIAKAKEFTESIHDKQKNVYFIQADAERLPIGDHSADEVFLGNVLGDGSISLAKKEKFLEEAKRILRENGTIVIKETNSPMEIIDLDSLLKESHLYLEKSVRMEDPDWEKEIKPYHDIGRTFNDRSYLLFLKPTKK